MEFGSDPGNHSLFGSVYGRKGCMKKPLPISESTLNRTPTRPLHWLTWEIPVPERAGCGELGNAFDS